MKANLTLYALSNILDSVERRSGLADLDSTERAILKFVGAQGEAGLEVCVTDVTDGLADKASLVTVLKRIKGLCAAGWLTQGSSQAHHRRITLQLSDKASREMAHASQAVDEAIAHLLRQA